MFKQIVKTILLVLMFAGFCTTSFTQTLAIDDLRKVNKMNIDDTETYLLSRKFVLTETGSDKLKTTIAYECETSNVSVSLNKYKKFGFVDLEYTTLERREYLRAKDYVKIKKFKVEGTKVGKGKVSSISSMYRMGDCFIILTSNNALSEDGVTKLNWYDIEISDVAKN